MSAHSLKTRNRHPKPATYEREVFTVGHVTFELCDHPKHGRTFALFAGEFPKEGAKALFSGHIQNGMGTALRRLAHRIDELEPGATAVRKARAV